MTTVTVKLYGLLRRNAGEGEYGTSADTVGSLLKELNGRYGKEVSRLLKYSIILVNGKNVDFLKGKKTPLQPGDVVSIFPRAVGG